MTKAELKSLLLKRVEKLNDENLLIQLNGILDSLEKAGQIWDNLKDEQKLRADESYEQSFDESKLTDWDEIYKRKR